MDLLDALEDLSSQRKTLKKKFAIDYMQQDDNDDQAQTQAINDDEENDNDNDNEDDLGKFLGLNGINIGTIPEEDDNAQDDNNTATQVVGQKSTNMDNINSSTPQFSKYNNLLANDIIKNVQRRLNGGTLEEEENSMELETQVLDQPKTQLIGTETQADNEDYFGTQSISLDIPIRLTQQQQQQQGNENSDDEINNSVQPSKPKSNRIFVSDSESDGEEDEDKVKKARLAKIAERAAAKKALREQLEQERLRTEAESDRGRGIDVAAPIEEKSKKDKELLAETRRLQRQVEYLPLPAKMKKFDVKNLFSEFGYTPEGESKGQAGEEQYQQQPALSTTSPVKEEVSPLHNKDNKSTPGTSPFQTPVKRKTASASPRFDDNEKDDDEMIENLNVLDILDKNKLQQQLQAQKQRRALNNPLKSYEERLNDNAVEKKGHKIIELDSDPEIDVIDNLKHHTSKETRLDIKTKFVQKKRTQGPTSALSTINLNKYFPIPNKKLARGFISALNDKATRQLRDVIRAKNIEKDAKLAALNKNNDNAANKKSGLSIEDLLEREIERNLRLRRKEKEKNQDAKSDDDGEYADGDDQDFSSEADYDESENASDDESEENESDTASLPAPVPAEVQVKSSFVEHDSQLHRSQTTKGENDDEDDEDDEEVTIAKHTHKRKGQAKNLLSEDDDDDESEDQQQEQQRNSVRSTQQQALEEDRSFMYGAADEDKIGDDDRSRNDLEDSNEFQLGSYGSQKGPPNLQKMFGISMTQAFESTLPQQKSGNNSNTTNVMKDLRQRQLQMIEEDETTFEEDHHGNTKDSFLAEEESFALNKKNHGDDNQLEDVAIAEESNMSIGTLSMPLQTQKMIFGGGNQANNVTIEQTKSSNGRRLIRKKIDEAKSSSSPSGSDSDSESDEETRKLNIALRKEKQRQRDIRRKRKLKEWKKKGVTAMMDDEASESEDEYKGLGGVDGEISDEENSEDEKMLDDSSRLDMKANELRLKFAQEEKKKNEDEVRKLLEDIKTGKLRNRRGNGGNGGLDIELSDDDEEDLKNFYLARLNNQRNRLLENEKIASIASNEKFKAFFETIAERPTMVRLDDDATKDHEVVEDTSSDVEEKENDDPFVEKKKPEQGQDSEEPLKKKRKVIKLRHDFIQRTISEVCDTKSFHAQEVEEETRAKILAKYQHSNPDNTDDVEDELDLLALKRNSSILMSVSNNGATNTKMKSASPTPDAIDLTSSNADHDNEDEEDEDFNPIKKSTLISSFRKQQSLASASSSSSTKGGIRREVTVTTSKIYKNSIGNKASIGYLQNKNGKAASVAAAAAKLLKTRTLKARAIERELPGGSSTSGGGGGSLRNVFKSGNFN